MSRIAVTVRVTGRVQGVAFRAWTRDTARGLGLSGWVANRPDGSVAAHLEGPDEAVRRMVAKMQDGPRFAVVRAVETGPADAEQMTGFEIRR